MSALAIAIAIASLFFGFCIGWSEAFHVVWSRERRREEMLQRIFGERDQSQ